MFRVGVGDFFFRAFEREWLFLISGPSLGIGFCQANPCELFFPLQSPGSPRGGNPRKIWEKITLNSPSRSNPENGEKLLKNYKKILRKYIFCNFLVIFPHFRGLDRGGEFCNFFPFFGDFRPGGFHRFWRDFLWASVMGSLAKGFLRNVCGFCGNFAEISRKYGFSRRERVRKVCSDTISDIFVKLTDSDTQLGQTLENVAHGNSHQKFMGKLLLDDTLGREKRRKCSLRTSAGWCQHFSNMPSVKWPLGFAKVAYQAAPRPSPGP